MGFIERLPAIPSSSRALKSFFGALALFIIALAAIFPFHLQYLTSRPVTADFQLPINLSAEQSHYQLKFTTEQLQALSLMGQAKEEQPIPELAELPETSLELTLSGVFANTQQDQAAALIGINGALPQYFYVGSTILPEIRLIAVNGDSVTLKSKKGFEKLSFPNSNIWSDLFPVEFVKGEENQINGDKFVTPLIALSGVETAPPRLARPSSPASSILNQMVIPSVDEKGNLQQRLTKLREKLIQANK